MTQTENAGYLAAFTEDQRAYFNSYPGWAVTGWALGVWGAVAGSALLLFRSRFAVAAFGVSLVGLLVTSLYSFAIAETRMTDVMGPAAIVITLLIYVTTIFTLVDSRRMAGAGVLR